MTKKIIPYRLSLHSDDFMIVVEPSDFDPKSQQVLVSLDNKVVEGDYSVVTNNIIAKITSPSSRTYDAIQGKFVYNNLRIKVLTFDFVKQRVKSAKSQEFRFNEAKLDYEHANNIMTASPTLIGKWSRKQVDQEPVKEEIEVMNVNGYFYNEDGSYEGKINVEGNTGNASDVYTCTGKSKGVDKAGKEIEIYSEIKLLKENDKNITHSNFCYVAYVVKEESGNVDIDELKAIAFTSFNRSKKRKSSWKSLLATGYSRVPNKKELSDTNNGIKDKLTRKALFSVLKGETDITNGAEYWDGTDFLAWGNSETNPDNKLGHNKFDEYKFIEIPKDIYDSFLGEHGSSVFYRDRGNHKTETDKGTHTHNKKKIKKKKVDKDGKPVLDDKKKPIFEDVEVPYKIKYSLPAAEFANQDYWTSGSFYYDTGVKTTYGISATITKGKSIFWKLTKTRLTSATPPKE